VKKLCIAFSIVWGILFALFLSLCLVAFLAHPVDLGETILLTYEDLTGDLGHTVAGMWNRFAWISLFVSISVFVLLSLNLVGAILFKPAEEEEEETEAIVNDQTPIEAKPKTRKKAVKEPKERKENIFKLAFKKIVSKFKKHKEETEKEVKQEVEEAVEEKVEEVVETVETKVAEKHDAVSDYLSKFKRK